MKSTDTGSELKASVVHYAAHYVSQQLKPKTDPSGAPYASRLEEDLPHRGLRGKDYVVRMRRTFIYMTLTLSLSVVKQYALMGMTEDWE